jgi:hypothetical protein
LNNGQNIVIKAGSTTAYFRIGYDLFSLTRTVYLKFSIVSGQTNGAGTYANIRPIRVVVYPTTAVDVEITPFTALAAGGRSKPLAFFLDKAPYKTLTVGVYQIGRTPDMMGIYPSQLVFLPGEKLKYFWLSTDIASKGSEGSVVFTLTGDTKGVYSFPNRQKTFYIYEGRTVTPVVLYRTIVGPTRDNKILVDLTTDSHCTAYFAVYPRGTLDVTITEIRNKKLRYDNYQGKYKLGEFVDSNSQNRIQFEIEGIEAGSQQMLKLLVQNTDGVFSEAIYYPFSTVLPEAPMKVYLQTTDTSILNSVFNQIKNNIADGGRLTTSTPSTDIYFEQLKIGEVAQDIPYPSNAATSDQTQKKKDFLSSKVQPETASTYANDSKSANASSANTLIAQEKSLNSSSRVSGIGSLPEFQKANEKRILRTDYVDLAIDYGTYVKMNQQKTIYTSKIVTPLEYGQEASIQDPYDFFMQHFLRRRSELFLPQLVDCVAGLQQRPLDIFLHQSWRQRRYP